MEPGTLDTGTIDTSPAHPYPAFTDLTLSLDPETVRKARRHAEAMGTSIDQLIREFLKDLAGTSNAGSDADEFVRLSRSANGNSHGWRFNREELHER